MSAKKDFKELMSIAKEFLKAVTEELDPWTKTKGEIIEDGVEAILLSPSHIQYARYGRGPGRKPPLESILEWVKAEGIKFETLTDVGTAFAIQNSIGVNGTKNWVPNAPSFLEESIKKHFQEYQIQLNQKLIVIINDEVNSIYKKIDFKDIM